MLRIVFNCLFINLITLFLFVSCSAKSDLYSLYADFHLEKSSLLLDNQNNGFVLNTWGWCGTGSFKWSSAKDTLYLQVLDNYEKTTSSYCACLDTFLIVFTVRDAKLWEVDTVPGRPSVYDSIKDTGRLGTQPWVLKPVPVQKVRSEYYWLKYGPYVY